MRASDKTFCKAVSVEYSANCNSGINLHVLVSRWSASRQTASLSLWNRRQVGRRPIIRRKRRATLAVCCNYVVRSRDRTCLKKVKHKCDFSWTKFIHYIASCYGALRHVAVSIFNIFSVHFGPTQSLTETLCVLSKHFTFCDSSCNSLMAVACIYFMSFVLCVKLLQFSFTNGFQFH